MTALTSVCEAASAAGTGAGMRKALVIGNAAYAGARLANPVNDAKAVAAALQRIGFEVKLHRDLAGRGQMRRAVNAFVASLGNGDTAFFYYAGHGVELDRKNFLLGVEFSADNEDDAMDEAYPLATLMRRLGRSKPKLSVIVIDACRDDPFTRSWSRSRKGRGLAVVERLQEDTYLAFAATPGQTASDGAGRKHSPFSSALLEHLETPGVELDSLFRKVRSDVLAATKSRQRPWSRHSLTRSVYFVPPTPQQARLSITTKRAGALVALAGEEIGRTPLVDYPVAPGHHSVRLQLPGHAPWEGSVAAVAGETVRIDRRMRAVSAVVKVRSQPPAARVLLDGAALEAPTPTTLADVRPGERTLRVELAYHAPWTKSVRLAAGRTYEFDATLKPEKGSLRVESEPAGALVWLDGRAVGATPLELDSVSAGPRTVALTADRFAKKVATVLVEAGRGAELKASLDLQKGSLQAVSTPEGAAIRVDGTLVGTTPAKGIALTPGRHVVRLSAKEHREFQQEIEVEPGGSHVVEANLQPLEGELLVRTEVADAAVFVDGAEVGLTPLDPIRLAPGRHRLTVDRNWHSPWSAWVHVNDAATTEVAAAPPGRRLAWSLAGGAALLGAGAGLAAVGWADARGDQSDAQDDYDAEAAKGIGDQSPETLDRLGADVDAAYDRKTRWSGVASIAGTLAVAAAAWSVYEFLSTGPVEADPVVAGPRPGPDSPRTQLSLTW